MGHVHVPVTINVVGSTSGGYEGVFLVDTGAMDSMAPASELTKIGIQPVGREIYQLADGSRHEFPFGLAQIELMGMVTAGRVVFGPEDAEPILGVTPMESVGVIVDPRSQKLTRLPAIGLKGMNAAY